MTVMSLLQPPPEVFALFDHVVLLNEGEVMYYGPRVRIQSYFTDLGLHCPSNRDVADFLLDLGTPQQQEYEATHGFAVPRLAGDYSAAYRTSDIHRGMLELLDEPVDPSEDIKTLPVFQRSMWINTLAIVKRQCKLLMRDTNTRGSRAILVLVVACVCSTNFINVDATNAPVTLGVLFMAPMFPLFEQSSQLSMFIETREIFYKQRSANFFQTSAYVLGNILSQVALAVPESFIYGALLYWIAGLEASASAFIVYELILLFTVLVAVLMLFLAAISPSIYVANPLALGLLQVIQVFAGFIVTRGQIPDYLVWIYWIDPMAWSFRALAVNQYRSSIYDMCEYKGVNYCDQFGKTMGEYYLAVYDIPSDRKCVALGLAYLLGVIVLFTTLSYLALECKRYDGGRMNSKVAEECDQYQLVTTPKHSAIEVKVHSQSVTPVTVAFQDVWYSVPSPNGPIPLLKGITGVAKPGTITALMGPSGAGKTTLLDVLAGRKTTGYCEQTMIHSETATIREALVFSAFLRQSRGIPDAAKMESVSGILELLDLQDIADLMVRGRSQVDFERQFNESELKTHLDLTMEEEGVGNPSTAIPALQFRRKQAASSFVQLRLLLLRFVNMYWRSPTHSITVLGEATGMMLVLGLVSSALSTTTYQGVSSGLGIIFIAFQSQGFVSFNSAITFAFEDRAAFYRERVSHTYSSLWVYCLDYPSSLRGFTSFSNFLLFWLAVSFSILSDVYLGHLLAFVFPNRIIAALAGSVVSSVFFLFVGFNPPGNSIPAGYQWLYTITPQRYAMSILGALVFGGCSTTPVLDVPSGEFVNVGPELGCQPLEATPVSIGNVTVKELLEDVYNMKHDDIARNFGALLVFIAVFRVLALLALHFLNHQKR